MGFPRQDAVSEAPLLEHQEEEEVFREDGQSMDGPHQATQVPEGEAGRSGQNTAPQGTQGAKRRICAQFCHLLDVGLRKADRSSNPSCFFWNSVPSSPRSTPSILSSAPSILSSAHSILSSAPSILSSAPLHPELRPLHTELRPLHPELHPSILSSTPFYCVLPPFTPPSF